MKGGKKASERVDEVSIDKREYKSRKGLPKYTRSNFEELI